MKVINGKGDLRDALKQEREAGKRIGFVPTMGYLHEGHASLIRAARQENDVVVVSVFVNPTQFGPNEDLDAYPRDTEKDLRLLQAERVDVAFFPTVEDIYPAGFTTYVEVQGPITKALCGGSRPGHFRGVTTVVSKLFNIVAPHRAYFGQKDAQQVAVIEQMVKDLDFNVQIVACPTVREADGLAMSSRNAYLSTSERRQALILSKALFESQDMIRQGERKAHILSDHIRKQLDTIDDALIDYVSIADARNLADLETLEGEVLIALAVKVGRTRLIDNIRIHV